MHVMCHVAAPRCASLFSFSLMAFISFSFSFAYASGIQLTFSKFEYGGALNPNFNAGPFELVLEGIETI